MIKINGKSLVKGQINGKEVQKIVINGNTVYTKSQPKVDWVAYDKRTDVNNFTMNANAKSALILGFTVGNGVSAQSSLTITSTNNNVFTSIYDEYNYILYNTHYKTLKAIKNIAQVEFARSTDSGARGAVITLDKIIDSIDSVEEVTNLSSGTSVLQPGLYLLYYTYGSYNNRIVTGLTWTSNANQVNVYTSAGAYWYSNSYYAGVAYSLIEVKEASSIKWTESTSSSAQQPWRTPKRLFKIE